jgi:hypothetical protein|nr:MAG TPA: hypothetical protein [Crassvirales sp.]
MKSKLLKKLRKDIIKHTTYVCTKPCSYITEYTYTRGSIIESRCYAGYPDKYTAMLFMHIMITYLLKIDYSHIKSNKCKQYNKYKYKEILYGKSK